jgi:hypothetical protein
VRLEGLSKLVKIFQLIWSRTRDLPACSIVPQPLHSRAPSPQIGSARLRVKAVPVFWWARVIPSWDQSGGRRTDTANGGVTLTVASGDNTVSIFVSFVWLIADF